MTDDAPKDWPLPLPPSVKAELQNQIAVISLNRPEKRNALSEELVLGWQTVFFGLTVMPGLRIPS